MVRGEGRAERAEEEEERGGGAEVEEQRWRRRGGRVKQGQTEGEFEAAFDFDSYSRSVDQRQVSDRSKRRPENGKT